MDIEYIVRVLDPVIRHGVMEIDRTDRKTVHTILETAVISYLVAMGYSPDQAIRAFEDYEKTHGEFKMYEPEPYYY